MGGVRVLGNPIKLSRDGARFSLRPPRLGEHTREILEALGYSGDELAALATST
jgi:crotonobetainyl-CoA:carnitine CoA-transferase CaiB-like acyl-CoA transferase